MIKHSEIYSPALIPAFPLSQGLYYAQYTPEAISRYQLFLHEEEVAKEISDDSRVFTKEEIYKIVLLAREVAQTSYSLQLVSNDDFADISQIFAYKNPGEASLVMNESNNDRRNNWWVYKYDNISKILKVLSFVKTAPISSDAQDLTAKLLASLKSEGNSAWEARVAAVLGYYSVGDEAKQH